MARQSDTDRQTPIDHDRAFLIDPAPERVIPEGGISPRAALDTIQSEVILDGDPEKNLATFVTTWMEPEARMVIEENLHRNYIDHAEYPRTAEISRRCVRMLHELFHGAGEPECPGAACAGSSEAVMLGALAMKWRWRERRKKAGKPTDRPNMVYGSDVHVVWDKFCRYFDVEPRQVPVPKGKTVVSAEEMAPHIDENTIGVVAVAGTTFTGECDDLAGIDAHLRELAGRGLEVPMHVDAASGGFVFPFSDPDFEWDFRLESVKSINTSGHKFGLVYPGVGWLVFRDGDQLPEDLVFYEDYLGQKDATFTLNFSGSSSFILAQYYKFMRLGKDGYRQLVEVMNRNRDALAKAIEATGALELVEGSGGTGAYRGGMGLRRVYRADQDCRVRGAVSRLSSRSWGLLGGGAGGHGAVECGPGVVFEKDNAVLKAGQWFAVVSPGAGGYGPAEKRDRAAVARDLAEGVIDRTTAREVYHYTV